MHEYFGVGPQVQEEVNDIYPRFLRWLPKNHLSMPSKHSLEIWRMVIANLIVDGLSPSFFVGFLVFDGGFWCLIMICLFVCLFVFFLIFLGSFVIFQMSLNP